MSRDQRTIEIDALTLHPELHRIPEMRECEIEELSADILDRGIHHAIELLPGTKVILDGRERWRAAKRAACERVPVVDADLRGEDPVLYMLRSATRRRHLSDDQRAMLAREELVYLAEKGKAQRVAKLIPGDVRVSGVEGVGVDRKSLSGKRPLVPDTASATRPATAAEKRVDSYSSVAKSHGLSERQLRNAHFVAERAPHLADQVRGGQLALARAVSAVARTEKIETMHQQAKVAASAARAALSIGELPWDVVTGDCVNELPRILRQKRPRQIFADPPYNEGVDYGDGGKADRRPEKDYLAWCAEWMQLSADGLAEDGSLWVVISKEYAGRYDALLRATGLHFRDLVVWYETFGVNCAGKFNRCCRVLLRFDKNSKQRVFNAHAVSRPSDRQTKYHDPRANPAGKLLDDLWEIPRLVGSCGERIPDFPTQLPLELLRRVIACASDPGDLIVDPFGGSGTTAAAAIALGRRSTLIEINPKFAELSRDRLRIASHRRLALKGSLIGDVTAIEKRTAEVGKLKPERMRHAEAN